MDRKNNSGINKRQVVLGFGVLVLLFLAGLWLIFQYAAIERERDLHDWRIRLGLIADHRTDAVQAWINRQFGTLSELAGNASLQLYTSQIELGVGTTQAETEPAQLTYLRNLLTATADRHGFLDNLGAQPAIRANVPSHATRGLALLSRDGRVIVATPNMPQLDDADREAVKRVFAGEATVLRDITLNAHDEATVGFLVPVAPIQGMERNGPAISGVLLGVKNVRQELFPLLASRGALTAFDETLLVRREAGMVVYLSELDDSLPTRRQLSLDTPNLAAAMAVQTPGGFAEAADYSGTPVLFTSRWLQGTPWFLLQTTESEHALRESNDHQRFLLTSFLLILFLVSASLIAAWRHGSSIRAQHMASELRAKTTLLENQSQLLHGITDNISDFIYLLDSDDCFVFATPPLARTTGIDSSDFPGKSLASVVGPDTAKRIKQAQQDAHGDGVRSIGPLSLEIGGVTGEYHCTFVALPDKELGRHVDLTVLHDVTELEEAQRKRSDLLRQLIRALMRAVDKHDPYSANHSSRMARVAVAIGEEMELDEADLQTLDLAANLANVGKIFIPDEVLTKSEELTGEEHELLQRHVQYSADILSSLEFEGPVLESIMQKQEMIDGSGYPQGLTGERMLTTGKILAVANAYVAMVSPRAYRDAVPMKTAVDKLLEQSQDKYDRHVVAALFHIAENRSEILDPPA